MARVLVWSIRRTFAYSMTASRYCSRAKYLSPRSRCRAFLASGDREHPATTTSTARRRTIHARAAADILISSVSLIGKVFGQNGVHSLDIEDEALRGRGHAPVNGASDSYQSAVGPVPQN